MTLAAMQHRRQQAKLQRKQNGRAPMLVMRGIRNDRVELNERMAAQAFISGFAADIPASPPVIRPVRPVAAIRARSSARLLAREPDSTVCWSAMYFCACASGSVDK